jgi:hypothetical protein
MNADGSGQTRLTDPPGNALAPAWAPDGRTIVFTSADDLWLLALDDLSRTRLTSLPETEFGADWSPDGSRIAFNHNGRIWSIATDGSDLRPITPPQQGVPPAQTTTYTHSPDWSPDGSRIVYIQTTEHADGETCESIRTIGADGSAPALVLDETCDPDIYSNWYSAPGWSPDGTRIASANGTLFTVRIDGSNLVSLPGAWGFSADWQPLRPAGYARPKGASATTVRLVPAYRSCTSGNANHGAPLALSSCSPPVEESGYATIGHGDGHPTAAYSAGRVILKVLGESPIDPNNGDQADVQLTASITDVRNKPAFMLDYTGELRVSSILRVTDRYSAGPFSPPIHPATTTDTPFGFTLTCIPTVDSSVGSTCSATTTADAVMPGVAREGQRAIWELAQIQVYDGGADGDADTAGDNTLFAVQGLFAP